MPNYAENFDSRSNLHSSVLEEFLYYLFRDLAIDFGENTLIGKSHTFKDIFFVPPNYFEMLKRPYAKIEKKDHDFVFGATIQASLKAVTPTEEKEDFSQNLTVVTKAQENCSDVKMTGVQKPIFLIFPLLSLNVRPILTKRCLKAHQEQ